MLRCGEFLLNGATLEMNGNLLRVTQLLQQGRLQIYFKIHGSIKEFPPCQVAALQGGRASHLCC